MPATSMDELVSLSKRRGFIYQAADIYGGSQGLYDYGPLGVELKNNLKAAWWRAMVYERDDVEGPGLHPPDEPACSAALRPRRNLFRPAGGLPAVQEPLAGRPGGRQMPPMRFRRPHRAAALHLMFRTAFGPVDDGSSFVYLRPETAQGIFTNFKNVMDSTSRRLPFGIAQMGKAFRNEITPRNFIFRVREFEQMELEFFVEPGEDEDWHRRWLELRLDWWAQQGVGRDALSIYDVPAHELAHYSKATYDIMYAFPHGLEELEGIANRRDFDLGSHSKNQDQLALAARVAPNPTPMPGSRCATRTRGPGSSPMSSSPPPGSTGVYSR